MHQRILRKNMIVEMIVPGKRKWIENL